MSERRAIWCPEHGPTIGERLGQRLVRCAGVYWANVAPTNERPRYELRPVPRIFERRAGGEPGGCGVLLATCAGCGGISLAGRSALRCPCGFARDLRSDEIEALGALPRVAPVQQVEQAHAPPRAMSFVPPPMPRFKPGAALPAPAKPRGYQPPKEKK